MQTGSVKFPAAGSARALREAHHSSTRAHVQVQGPGTYHRYLHRTSLKYCNDPQAVLVFDVANRASFEELEQWLAEAADFGAGGIPMAVCANKVRVPYTRVSLRTRGWFSNQFCLKQCVAKNTRQGALSHQGKQWHEHTA